MACTLPGMCSFDPNCASKHCPGRQIALDAADLAAGQRALHTEDGGTWLTEGHRVLRLRHEERSDEPPITPDQAKGWAARVVDFLLAVFVVGCLYGACRALIFGLPPF
jgi:hypothetical protein